MPARRSPVPPPTDYAAQAAAQANQAVPRPGYDPGTDPLLEQWFSDRLAENPNYKLPAGYKAEDGRVKRDTHSILDDILMYGLPAAGFGIAGAGGLGAFGGGGGAAGAAADVAGPSMPGVVSGIPAGTTFGSGTGAALKTGGLMSKIGGFFKGVDPTSLILGGLSLIGGNDDPFQRRTGYTGNADPQKTMEQTLGAIKALGSSIANQPVQEVSRDLGTTPTPVTIPGIPFQIGGGLGSATTTGGVKPTQAAPSPFGPSATASSSQPTSRKRPQ